MSSPTDIAYIHTAYSQLSPIYLAGVFASLGWRFPTGPLRICEIGCGTGLSAAITAATLPDAKIVALDASVRHVEMARTFAERAGLANLHVHAADIRSFDCGLDDFDLILTHGVLAWVGEDVRRAIYTFIDRYLRPCGVAYLHYASHPGAASLASVHKAVAFAGPTGGSTIDRVREGLSLVSGLREGGGFFAAHPKAGSSFDALLREPDAFVAHEIGGRHWSPLHSADVITDMERIGCRYVGSALPIQNIDALSLPTSTIETVRRAGSVALAETLKDIARDESMRQDLFTRGGTSLDPTAHLELLRRTRYVSMRGVKKAGGIAVPTRIGQVEVARAVLDPIAAALADGPVAFAALEALPSFAGRPALLNQSLALLMTNGYVHPAPPIDQRADAAIERLNAILRQMRADGATIPFVFDARFTGSIPN